MACHRLHSQAGMHQGMGMLSQLLGVTDASVLDEMDVEASDPTYATVGHEVHQRGLEDADKGMRGATVTRDDVDDIPTTRKTTPGSRARPTADEMRQRAREYCPPLARHWADSRAGVALLLSVLTLVQGSVRGAVRAARGAGAGGSSGSGEQARCNLNGVPEG